MTDVRRRRPDEQLLLLLSEFRPTPEQTSEAAALLRLPLDWDAWLHRCLEEGVYPMVHRNLVKLEGAPVPAAVREELSRLYRMNAVRCDLMRDALRDILRKFGEEGIPVIPIKGVALSQTLYGDHRLRAVGDIDILVPHAEAARAVHCLAMLGYAGEPFEPETGVGTNTLEHNLVKHWGEFGILVELHWAIMWGKALDQAPLRQLWGEASPRDFFGMSALAPTPEWELILLAGHAARSRWHQLKWVADVAAYASKPNLDWDKVWKLSAATGWNRAVRWSLQVTQRVFGRPAVPREPFPRWIRHYPESSGPGLPGLRDCSDPRLLDRPSARLRFLGFAILAPRLSDRLWWRLPKRLASLYYLFRPLRLVWQALYRALRRPFSTSP